MILQSTTLGGGPVGLPLAAAAAGGGGGKLPPPLLLLELSTPATGCTEPEPAMVLDWRVLQPETVKQITTANPARESRYFMVRPPLSGLQGRKVRVIGLDP